MEKIKLDEAKSLSENEKELLQNLKERDFDSVLEVKKGFPLLVSSPKVQIKVAEALVQVLRRGLVGMGGDRNIEVYKKWQNLLEDQSYLYEGAKNILGSGYTTGHMMGTYSIDETLETLKVLNMPENIDKEIAINAIGNLITREQILDAIKIKNELAVSNKELYSNPEFLGNLENGILNLLDANNNTGVSKIAETKKLAEEFEIPDGVLNPIVKQAMFSNMRRGRDDKAVLIQTEFSLPSEDILKSISSDDIVFRIVILLEATSLYNAMLKIESEFEDLTKLSKKGYLSRSEVDKIWGDVVSDKKLIDVAKRVIKTGKEEYANEVAKLLNIKDWFNLSRDFSYIESKCYQFLNHHLHSMKGRMIGGIFMLK